MHEPGIKNDQNLQTEIIQSDSVWRFFGFAEDGLGFLWFNAHPAQVFMGDVGSLSLGGVLGIIALFIKHELLLVIIGAVYVAEAFSVVLQVFYYKMFKKRIFKMAPLHHHFEKSGWKETQVVFRFYILGIIAAIIGIATLKIR